MGARGFLRVGLSMVFLASSSWSASAAAYEFFEERGGWSIVGDDDNCSMLLEYEGPGATTVIVAKETNGFSVIGITNANWSTEAGEEYDVDFAIDDRVFPGSVRGYRSSGKSGFLIQTNDRFDAAFRAGRSLHLYRDGELFDRLSLTGTAVASAAVERCLVGLRREEAAIAREKARYADIAPDPFQRPHEPKAASPRLMNASSLITARDYPREAINEKRGGTSKLKIEVDEGGVAQTCAIIESSGHGDLDAAACTAVMRRARFSPAIDDAGNQVGGIFEIPVAWRVPEDPPPPPTPITCVPGEVCTRE